MTKHLVRWKNTKCVYAGQNEILPFGKEIDLYYQGTLLSRLLQMKKQTPITFESAILLLIKHEDVAYSSGRKGTKHGEHLWYQPHFVEWLSEIGYHVELTGDEFESSVLPDQVV